MPLLPFLAANKVPGAAARVACADECCLGSYPARLWQEICAALQHYSSVSSSQHLCPYKNLTKFAFLKFLMYLQVYIFSFHLFIYLFMYLFIYLFIDYFIHHIMKIM